MHIYALTRGSLLKALACFILGLIIGLTLAMIWSAWTIDKTLIEIETLRSELSEKQNAIEKLEFSLIERRQRFVKNISIIMDEKDQHRNLKIAQAVKGLLEDLIGREVDSIDPPLVFAILNGRTIAVEKQLFTLKANILVISETLTVYLSVTPHSDDPLQKGA
ncbi:MAG: hypothetical protein GX020_06485 [Firmicutes bacterium]|nr:hypothetical protein [Bacillota bacterium]